MRPSLSNLIGLQREWRICHSALRERWCKSQIHLFQIAQIRMLTNLGRHDNWLPKSTSQCPCRHRPVPGRSDLTPSTRHGAPSVLQAATPAPRGQEKVDVAVDQVEVAHLRLPLRVTPTFNQVPSQPQGSSKVRQAAWKQVGGCGCFGRMCFGVRT